MTSGSVVSTYHYRASTNLLCGVHAGSESKLVALLAIPQPGCPPPLKTRQLLLVHCLRVHDCIPAIILALSLVTKHQEGSQEALHDALSVARRSDSPLVTLLGASGMLNALGNAIGHKVFHDLKKALSALPIIVDTTDDNVPTAFQQGQHGIDSQQEADIILADTTAAKNTAKEVEELHADEVDAQQTAILQQQLHKEEDLGAQLSDAFHQLITQEWGLQALLQASQLQRSNVAAGVHECIRSDEEQGQAGAVIAILQMLQLQVRNHNV